VPGARSSVIVALRVRALITDCDFLTAGELKYLLNRIGAFDVGQPSIAALFLVDRNGDTRLPPGTDPRQWGLPPSPCAVLGSNSVRLKDGARVGHIGAAIYEQRTPRQLRSGRRLRTCSSSETLSPKNPSVRMEIIAGQNDTAEVGTVVPISAKITDANGTIVPGQLVHWVITAGSGSLFVAASIADQSGIARNRLSLGSWENRVELKRRQFRSAHG
jgi:hypothetical protein